MRRLLRDYSLGWALLALFLLSWAGQAFTQYHEFTQQQTVHGQPPVVGEFWMEFWSRTFENWQSEFVQLLTFVALSKLLFFRGSPEAKDPPDAG